MAIINRKGQFVDFDPSKMLPGEWAVVLDGDSNSKDGKSIYMCFSAGVVKRMATYDDMVDNINNATEDVQNMFTEEMRDAINQALEIVDSGNAVITNAQSVLQSAEQATKNANDAAEEAKSYVLGDISSKTVTFLEASSRVNIASDESTATLFGKIKKFFTDLKPHAFTAPVQNLTTNVAGSALDATMGKKLQEGINTLNSNLSDITKESIFVGSEVDSWVNKWFKVCDQTCSGYGNTNIMFAVTRGFTDTTNKGQGILSIQIRSNNTSIYVSKFAWLANSGLDPSDFIIVISGMSWTLYARNTMPHNFIHFEGLSRGSITESKYTWPLNYTSPNTTPETTDPVATKISEDGVTVTGLLLTQGGTGVLNVGGSTTATAGYVKVATITVNTSYANYPITFEFTTRAQVKPMRVYLLFKNSSTSDPEIDSFQYEGADIKAYIKHTGVSTWDLYVARGGWSGITISDYKKDLAITGANMISVELSKVEVDALPDGAIPATDSNINSSVAAAINEVLSRMQGTTFPLTLASGFTENYVSAKKKSDGIIIINFSLTGSGAANAHTLLATIPVKYRPAGQIITTGHTGLNGPIQVIVETDGSIKAWGTTAYTTPRGTIVYTI